MRYLLAVILAAVLVLVGVNVQAEAKKRPAPTWNNTNGWIDTVWQPKRWQRGQPKQRSLRYYRWALKNAASEIDRRLIKRRWRRSKRAYYKHRKHCRSGMVIEGRVSWFSDGTTASGLSAAYNAGLALNLAPGTDSGWNNSTTRGWVTAARNGRPVMFRVTIGGRSAVMPVIDLGPAGYVGRAIDVSGPGVDMLGLSRSAFPTDSWGRAKLIPEGCLAGA